MRLFSRWFVVFVPVLIAAAMAASMAVGPRERASDEDILRTVSAVAARLAEDDHFSGTVAVAKDGVPILERSHGMANRRTGLRNQMDTVYSLASVGKMFTTVAVGQLIAQGDLGLDDTVGEHLPTYPSDGPARDVTIGQMLTHTSGMPDFLLPPSREKYLASVDADDPHRDYLPIFSDEPLNFAPGSRYEYSNSNYLVLGAIVEAVSGQSYYEYVEENIFRPANMTETVWTVDDVKTQRVAVRYTELDADGRLQQGERRRVDPARNGPMQLPDARSGGHGGGLSTASDILKFFWAIRNRTILSADMFELLLTPPEGPGRGEQAYGFRMRNIAWFRRPFTDDSAQAAVGHGGSAQGVLAEAYMYPHGYDVVVLSNYESGADELMATIDDLLLR